jgi:hypothetical protein
MFHGGSLIEDINTHKIANPGFKFQAFTDIKQGKIRPDVLIGKLTIFLHYSLFEIW